MFKLKNQLLAVVLSFSAVALGIAQYSPTDADAAAKKPTLATKATVNVGKTKKLSIKKNGFTIKKVTSKSSKKSVATVKATKKAITIKGVKAGAATITTSIKATKAKKTKTYKIKTKITVKSNSNVNPVLEEDPTLDMYTKGDGMGVKIVSATSLELTFDGDIDAQSLLRLKLTKEGQTGELPIVTDKSSVDISKKTINAVINDPGLEDGNAYTISLVEDNTPKASVTFRFKKITPVLSFTEGTKKTISNIVCYPGAKVAELHTNADKYGLTVNYEISGMDSPQFEMSSSGVLMWKHDAAITDGKNKLSITITASTIGNSLYNSATASINLVIKLK